MVASEKILTGLLDMTVTESLDMIVTAHVLYTYVG